MIHLESVTKEYDLPTGKSGQLVAADHLTLQVPADEVFGLVGPNGAGKTTATRTTTKFIPHCNRWDSQCFSTCCLWPFTSGGAPLSVISQTFDFIASLQWNPKRFC